MSKIRTLIKIIKKPSMIIEPLGKRGLLNWLDDEKYITLVYKSRLNKRIDLKNPQGFNEKLQWLKLNRHDSKYIKLVDKINAKSEISKIISEEYIVPLISRYDSADAIDFGKLPDRCVIKCNHDQGSTIIYERGKDENKIREHFRRCLKKNQYYETREWPYKSIVPQILCEPFLADDIIDYKFFCFNGKAEMINIGQKNHVDKSTNISFLDLNWQPMPFQRKDFKPMEKIPDKPECLDKMIELAEKISSVEPFVRVDFFLVDGHIYFSEFTLYPTSGYIQFDPETGDDYLGKMLLIK